MTKGIGVYIYAVMWVKMHANILNAGDERCY